MKEIQSPTQALQFTLPEAIEMYPGASEALKTKLESAFGKKALTTDVLERLKDADLDEFYQEAGRPRITSISELPEDLHEFFLDFYDGVVMHEAVNQGKRLSFLDQSQPKYYAWLKLLPSGGVDFDGTLYSDADAYSGDASRLRAISAEAASVIGKNKNCQKVLQNIMNH
jgi:hypothetical protein